VAVHALVPYFGWINENNGADHNMTGAPIVVVYMVNCKEGKKNEVVATINMLVANMKATGDQANMPHLRFDM